MSTPPLRDNTNRATAANKTKAMASFHMMGAFGQALGQPGGLEQ
jgi:hypothetical protein